jgi:hypothetical protein
MILTAGSSLKKRSSQTRSALRIGDADDMSPDDRQKPFHPMQGRSAAAAMLSEAYVPAQLRESKMVLQPPARKNRLTLAKRFTAPARPRTSRPAAFTPRDRDRKQDKYPNTSEANAISPGERGEEMLTNEMQRTDRAHLRASLSK